VDVELWCSSSGLDIVVKAKRLSWRPVKLEAELKVHIVHFQLRLELGLNHAQLSSKSPPTIEIDTFSSAMELVLPGKNIKN